MFTSTNMSGIILMANTQKQECGLIVRTNQRGEQEAHQDNFCLASGIFATNGHW